MQSIDSYTVYTILAFTFAIGLSVGSFVTMASYRLPLEQEIVFKPSYCPKCGTPLKAFDLIPLFSWLLQRGKCRHCHAPISKRYPLTEFSLGIVFVLLVLLYGISFNTLLLALLATELCILIVTDLEHFIIPDSIQIALAVTGIAYAIYHNLSAQSVAQGVGAGFFIGLLLHYGYLYLRHQDALGWGDVKFMAVVGTWLPIHDFVTFFFLAGLIGVFTGLLWRIAGRGAVFPFGPALACSLFVNVLFPDMLYRIGP